VQYARDGFSYFIALLHGTKECDIHLSLYFIVSLLLHRFVLVDHRINLLPHYTFTTKLPTSIPYSFSLIFPLSISTVFSWYLHYLIMGSSLVSLKCLGAVWMDLKIKTFILIVTEKRTALCAHTVRILNLLHM